MSEGRKNKRYSNKEPRRQMTLFKKDDEKNSDDHDFAQQQPKILLKQKEKEPQQIQIQVQQKIHPDKAKIQTTKTLRESAEQSLQQTANSSTSCKDNKELAAPPITEHFITQIPLMERPVELIIPHTSMVNTQAFEYISENNTDFLVVGVIGMQGVGKSTLINLLMPHEKNQNIPDKLFNKKSGVFNINNLENKRNTAGNKTLPSTEGIEMFITKDRVILLDCTPVLANPYQKELISSEMDDIKLLIFLINVCHLLIVVQDDFLNTNFIRLIQCAEMMKPPLDKEQIYNCNVMFIKNFSNYYDYNVNVQQKRDNIIKQLFKHSKLNIYLRQYITMQNNFNHSIDDSNNLDNLINDKNKIKMNVNSVTFPLMNCLNDAIEKCTGLPDIQEIITEFRHRVFMTPRTPMIPQQLQQVQQQQQQQSTTCQPPIQQFTEKHWSLLCISVWESHQNNFFLRKYEQTKYKHVNASLNSPGIGSSVSVSSNNDTDRYMDFY